VIAYGSFFGHLERCIERSGSDLSFERIMSYSVGVLLLINLVGLTMALWRSGRREQVGA